MRTRALAGWRVVLLLAACPLVADAQAPPAPPPSGLPAAPAAIVKVKPAFAAGETLYYEVGWNGITAAEAKVWVEKGLLEEEEIYTFRVTARTTSFVDKLYELRANAWSKASADTLLPLQNRLSQTENGRRTTETILFDPEKKTAAYTREKQEDAGKAPTIQNATIPCATPGDAFALAYLLRSQSLKVGDVKSTEIVVGRHLYAFSVKVEARERIKVKAGTFDALRLIPVYHQVGKAPDKKKVREMVLWISDDEKHLPLKVTAEAFVGHMYGELTRVEADPAPKPLATAPKP